MTTSAPDSAAAATKYRALAGDYDRRAALRISASARRRAVKRLELRPGGRVLDVACGTGLNFDAIQEAIGSSGQLVGVDLSAEMLAWAHERVRERGWENVRLLRSTIEDARLDGPFDAALFSFTHDVLRSPRAVGNVISHLRRGGRVAAAGVRSIRGAA